VVALRFKSLAKAFPLVTSERVCMGLRERVKKPQNKV